MHLMFEFYSLRQTYYYKYVINIHLYYEPQSLPNFIVEKIVKFIKLSQETNHKICYMVLVKWISKFIKCFWDKNHKIHLSSEKICYISQMGLGDKIAQFVKWVSEEGGIATFTKQSWNSSNDHKNIAKLEEQSCKKTTNFVEKS